MCGLCKLYKRCLLLNTSSSTAIEPVHVSPHLQHGRQDPLVAAQGEEVVEVHSGVDGGGGVLPEEGAVLRVQQQRPVEDVEEQHHLVAPRVLAGHAQEHLLQQLDPQHLVEGVQPKQLLAWGEARRGRRCFKKCTTRRRFLFTRRMTQLRCNLEARWPARTRRRWRSAGRTAGGGGLPAAGRRGTACARPACFE